MRVLKFGGTSVGSVENMRSVASLIGRGGDIVVLSAMSGTTSMLIEISNLVQSGSTREARIAIEALSNKYNKHFDELLTVAEYREEMQRVKNDIFERMYSFVYSPFSAIGSDKLLACGELLSTNMMQLYLTQIGVNSVLISALDFMRLNENCEPDIPFLKSSLNVLVEENPAAEIFITQGFICRNAVGEITNLKRGGSDYTASLIGAAIQSSEIQIWTDIDGMHNNDPRFVEGTTSVSQLNFEEAAELAYFGAKILHPTCILPAQRANIPVKLLNTMQPEAHGTIITNDFERGTIKAVAAKDGITAIKIRSTRMLLAAGFLSKIFEVFSSYNTSIDMITTSEVGVSVTIDDNTHLSQIVQEMEQFGCVTVDYDMTIICVVGDFEWDNVGFEASIVNSMRDIPVRMISYGGSNYNVSLLVKSVDKVRSLQAISQAVFRNSLYA